MDPKRTALRATDLAQTPGFQYLRDAGEAACEVGQDIWQFAVEIDALRIAGLTHNDLRWLIICHYVDHREEMTRPGDGKRRFRRIHSLMFPPRTCFALSGAGNQFANQSATGRKTWPARTKDPVSQYGALARPGRAPAKPTARRDHELPRSAETPPLVPAWNPTLHELRLGKRLIKRFTHPAPAQELILSAFQEENWPAVIDDPLMVQFEQDPKRRLHYTIRNLNRAQNPLRIRFFINGSGQTIRWELIRVKRAGDAQSAR